jgi:hypothetical protein
MSEGESAEETYREAIAKAVSDLVRSIEARSCSSLTHSAAA